ncbi:hypothetical protein B0H16DRAFT_1711857 [Mycena metata]|uniref:Uncharacterized protein n=1 Tax=Mycena metata TaxID=1033252 RepID=A0AAD7NW29_9AGAR|nr:hypothetical protein B0H16DRAFT_1711857 [Mycena metata]
MAPTLPALAAPPNSPSEETAIRLRAPAPILSLAPSLAFSIDKRAELDEDDPLEGPPLRDLQKTPLDSSTTLTSPSPRYLALPSSAALPARRYTPDTEPDFDALEDRAGSPDIAAILATTPRPRLSSLARRTSDFDHEPPWDEEFIDDYGQVRGSVYSVASKASEGYAFGFPEEHDAQSVSSDNGHPIWDEPNDSDSDLDLHTALPSVRLFPFCH